MFEINDVVRLTKIERVSIEEIALIDDVYYIKSACPCTTCRSRSCLEMRIQNAHLPASDPSSRC